MSVRRSFSLLLGLSLAASLVACEGRPQSGAGSTPKPPRKGPSLLVFDLSSGVPEVESSGFFGPPPGRRRSLDALLDALDEASRDKDAKGLVVRFGMAQIPLARSEEIAQALGKVRAKMPVYCHAHAYTNATLYLAAQGCSKTYVSPAGEVEAIGIAAQIVYMNKLLTEELHLDVNFEQVGKFKGAEEPLTRDGPSDEARQSLEGTLADMRKSWLAGIAAGKNKGDLAVEDGPYSPTAAKAAGLVDEVGYEDEARDAAKAATGAVRDVVKFGPGSVASDEDPMGDLVRALAGPSAAAPIALVRATGEISMGGGGSPFGGESGITEAALSKELARVEKDDGIKAVVLRIDSPGGSALASDLLWHDLMKVRAKKKLVVSVGGMAASGGYYLASTGDAIFADATSIVGSIGVVGGKIAGGDALARIGVHAVTFAADPTNPGAQARAAYESPLIAWDEPTKKRVLESMTGVYDLFLARVSEGRKMPREKVAASAEGRIFSGREGKDRGLVDEIGGLWAAIAKARSLAGLPDDAAVEVMLPRPRLAEMLGGSDDGADEKVPAAPMESAARAAAESELTRVADALAPGLSTFAASMTPLARGEHTVCALPFALEVK